MLQGAFCSTEIQFIEKEELVECLKKLATKNILLLTNKEHLKEWGVLESVEQYVKNYEGLWIEKKYKYLTENEVFASLQQIGEEKIEQIVAIGGGSTLDLAKYISAFSNIKLNNADELIEMIENKSYLQKEVYPKIVAIPTTAGTGSEVTKWATLWKSNGNGKLSIESSKIQPHYAYMIPEFMVTVPQKLTIITGLDALVQAIEAYWARNSDYLVKDIAIRAIDLILYSLPLVKVNGENLLLRTNMCRGALLAGIAFAKTRTTACHSISYYLTQKYGIEHGIAVAITVDAVWNRNKQKINDADILEEIFKKYGGLGYWLQNITNGLISLKLNEYGVMERDIDMIVENSFVFGRMNNNPIIFGKEEIRKILQECW